MPITFAALVLWSSCTRATQYDVVLRNGLVCDDSSASCVAGGVAINGDTIAKVGDLARASGKIERDVHGQLIAPVSALPRWWVSTRKEDASGEEMQTRCCRHAAAGSIFGTGAVSSARSAGADQRTAAGARLRAHVAALGAARALSRPARELAADAAVRRRQSARRGERRLRACTREAVATLYATHGRRPFEQADGGQALGSQGRATRRRYERGAGGVNWGERGTVSGGLPHSTGISRTRSTAAVARQSGRETG